MRTHVEQTSFDNIDLDEDWKKEWVGMPEYEASDLTSYASIIVHFRNRQDMEAFSQLIKQPLKANGMRISVWFPKMEHRKTSHLRWEDEP